MPLLKMLAFGIVLLSALPAAAQVQPQTTLVPCNAFQKNPDGSWNPVRQVVIAGPDGQVTVSPGTSFWVCETDSIEAVVAEAKHWLMQTQAQAPTRGATHYRVVGQSGAIIGGPP